MAVSSVQKVGGGARIPVRASDARVENGAQSSRSLQSKSAFAASDCVKVLAAYSDLSSLCLLCLFVSVHFSMVGLVWCFLVCSALLATLPSSGKHNNCLKRHYVETDVLVLLYKLLTTTGIAAHRVCCTYTQL